MPPWSIISKLHAVCEQSWAQIDKIEKFPRRPYQQNWKIVNSLHQLAALQMFRLKLYADRWNRKISKNHTQIIKSISILHVVHYRAKRLAMLTESFSPLVTQSYYSSPKCRASFHRYQLTIQDFGGGGHQLPMCTYYFFAKNCMKMKE